MRLAHRYNLITDQQLKAVVQALNEGTTNKQGELMIREGLAPERLNQLLERQTAARFAAMMLWKTGRFRIKRELPTEIPGVPCGVIDAYFEYARERWTPASLIEAANSLTEVVVQIPANLPAHLRQELNAHPVASAWLARLSGQPAPLVKIAGAPSRQTARHWLLVDALRSLGVLVVAEDTSGTSPAGGSQPVARDTSRPLPETVHATAVGAGRGATADTAGVDAAQSRPSSATPEDDGARLDERQDNPELDAKYEEMREQNWFEILGLPLDATARDVKKAYFRLAKEYHPDRFFDQKTRRPSHSAEKIFSLINQAYETLRDDAERERYRDYLERGTTEEEEMRRAEAILTSEVEFQKAQVLIKLKKYGDAIAHLQEAIALHDEPEYHVNLAWARFMHGWPDDKAACDTAMLTMKDLLERTGKVNTAEAWYLYGRMQKIAGNTGSAKRAFERVLKLDKSHKDAQRELRVLGD
ncbi:MAG: J domain-containing protein [Candidatus Dadabacteria bacterium]|nr:MAG: J domain-containing protein [Candidatus Dadabacteria bacterium]